MQFKCRFRAIFIRLGCRINILSIDLQDHISDLNQLLHGGDHFIEFFNGIVPFQFDPFARIRFGHLDDAIDILLAATGKLVEMRVGGQRVFQVTHLEHICRFTNNLTDVVDISPVSKHVRNLELFTAFGIGVTGHHHGNLSSAQVVSTTASLVNTFNLSLGITEGNELLQELGITVLNIIQINHHVIAHFQRQVQLINFISSTHIRCLCRIKGGHVMTDGWPVDLHENDTEPVGNVFHQRGLTITGRRN